MKKVLALMLAFSSVGGMQPPEGVGDDTWSKANLLFSQLSAVPASNSQHVTAERFVKTIFPQLKNEDHFQSFIKNAELILLRSEAEDLEKQLKEVYPYEPFYNMARFGIRAYERICERKFNDLLKGFLKSANMVLTNRARLNSERRDQINLVDPTWIGALDWSSFVRANEFGSGVVLTKLISAGFNKIISNGRVLQIDMSFDKIVKIALQALNDGGVDEAKREEAYAKPFALSSLRHFLKYFGNAPSENKAEELTSLFMKNFCEIIKNEKDLKQLPEEVFRKVDGKLVKDPERVVRGEILKMAADECGYRELISIIALFVFRVNNVDIGEPLGPVSLSKIKILCLDRPAQQETSSAHFMVNSIENLPFGMTPDGFLALGIPTGFKINIAIKVFRNESDSSFQHEFSHMKRSLLSPSLYRHFFMNQEYSDDLYIKAKNALSYSFQRKDFPIPYAEALLPISKVIMDSLEKMNLTDDEIGKILNLSEFMDMENNLKDVELVKDVTSPDALRRYVFSVIALNLQFSNSYFSWGDADEIITIFGRCPFAYKDSSGNLVMMEIIDKENQSAFEKRIILHHNGPQLEKDRGKVVPVITNYLESIIRKAGSDKKVPPIKFEDLYHSQAAERLHSEIYQ